MVTIISCPAQCKLRHVTRSYHHSVSLVGNIHKYLRSLPCLSILISHIMNILIMSDIFKMLSHSLHDIDFPKRTAKLLSKLDSIIICSVCCAKAWHCNTMNSASVKAAQIKCPYSHKKCQCRVKSARYSNYCILTIRMFKSLLESI